MIKKSFKSLQSKNSNLSGFTLVEILVVISILAIVGVIFTEIFFRSLRGSNQAQIINKIKQEGQNALSSIDRDIRSADNILCPNVSSGQMLGVSDILVTEKDGKYTRYLLKPSTTQANSAIQQDYPQESDFASKEEFKTRICLGEQTTNAVFLTDNNLKTGVSIKGEGIFTREIKAGQKDFVTVSFQVTPGNESPQTASENLDPVLFQTTIGLR